MSGGEIPWTANPPRRTSFHEDDRVGEVVEYIAKTYNLVNVTGFKDIPNTALSSTLTKNRNAKHYLEFSDGSTRSVSITNFTGLTDGGGVHFNVALDGAKQVNTCIGQGCGVVNNEARGRGTKQTNNAKATSNCAVM